MEDYSYAARNLEGQLCQGVLRAGSRREAVKNLQEQGLFIARLEAVPFWRQRVFRSGNGQQAAVFCRQLALMLEAGLSVQDAVGMLGREASGKKQAVLQAAGEELQAGASLSRALERQADFFPAEMLCLLAAAEAGGSVDKVIGRLAAVLERSRALQEKLKTAMLYPCFLFGLTLLVFIFLLCVVLPSFALMYENLGVVLPFPTRVLMEGGKFFGAHAGLLLGVGAGGVSAAGYALRRERVRQSADCLALRFPVWGRLCVRRDLWRFFTILSLLHSSGIVIDEAAVQAAEGVRNRCLRRQLRGVPARLRRGSTLAAACRGSSISPLLLELLAAGEAAGELAFMLEHLAELCRQEADTLAQRLQVLIEPCMLVFLGLVIGGLVLGLLYPLLTAVDAFC